ncbi:unnamed protein product [Cunninghamella echinulata]
METFIGHIKTPQDALIIFEACRRGLLNRVKRRLSNKERMNIKSGSIFAFDENEAGMRRWTDGRTWSPSRVLGSFLTYRELDTKRRPRKLSTSTSSVGGKMNSQNIQQQQQQQQQQQCIYKPNGLIKQSFSICTATNQKIHLISYYSKSDVLNGRLALPTQDPHLSKIGIPKGLYPELNPLDTSGGHSATLHLLMNSNQQQRQHQHQSFNHNEQDDEEEDDDDDHPHSSTSSTSSTTRYHYASRYHQLPSLSSSPMSTCSDDDILSPSHTSISFSSSSSSSHPHSSQPSSNSQHKKYHHQHNPSTSSMISSTTSPKLPTPLSPHYHHPHHQQQQQQQQQHHHHQSSLLPPVQVWKPYPLQPEDTRQLEALKTQLRI